MWTFRQYSGFGTAEESNAPLPLPARAGRHRPLGRARPAHPVRLRLRRSRRRARRSAASAWRSTPSRDVEILFDGIPLDRLSTSFTINGTAAILLAFYVAAPRSSGVPREKLRGTIQNDILKEYAARGTWIWPAKPSMRLIGDTIEFCAAEVPALQRDLGGRRALPRRWRHRGAGDGLHAGRRRRLLRRGRLARADDDRPVRPPGLVLLLHPRGLLRGGGQVPRGRRRWAQIVKERYGAQDERSAMFRFGCVCGRRLAVRAAGPEQRGARGLRGDGLGARRRAVDVHRRLGRAVRAAHRGSPPRWRCAPSRSSRTRPAWRAWWTRSAAPTTSRRSPTRWRSRSWRSWTTSSRTAAWCAASRTATCSG